MSQAGPGKYWAFLSYSHADAAACARLHRALEDYTLPASVRRAHALPRRLIPVFRDQEELSAASGLTETLRAALDESRWLIVLCSPAAAQSKYVNAEIEYFVARRGASNVLCVLLEGEPADSFPPALRALTDEPLAADLREGAEADMAVLKLISAMATIGFTELRNREARRRRRNLALLAGVAIVVTLGSALASLVYWDATQREFVEHYAHYVRKWGIWHGIHPLTPEQAAQRGESYLFTRHGRRNPPERVDYLDAKGECPDGGMMDWYPDRPLKSGRVLNNPPVTLQSCGAEFSYLRNGEIMGEVDYANYYLGLGQLTYWGEGIQARSFGYGPGTRPQTRQLSVKRDALGYDWQIRFFGNDSARERNRFGDYGYHFSYDAEGRVVKRVTLDDKDNEIGPVIRVAWNADDRPVLSAEDLQGHPLAFEFPPHPGRFYGQ